MSLPPSGEIPQGAIRFNTDSQRLEFYAQGEWWVMSTDTPNLGTSGDSTPGARGVISEVHRSGSSGFLTYINISSAGNAVDFGALNNPRYNAAGLGSRTRGVFGSGYSGSESLNAIDFVTIASTGNAADFGDLSYLNYVPAAFSNETRGIWAGGFNLPAGI